MVAWNKGKTKAEYPQLSRTGLKGHRAWNKGKRYPSPWLREFRFGTRPRPVHDRSTFTAEERKQKWGSARKGKRISKEHIQALISARNPRRTGQKISEETRQKMRDAALSHRDVMRKNGIKGCIQKGQETNIERIIYKKLSDLGIIYEKQKVINGKFIVDVFVPDHNLIIEVDGTYWHSLDRIQKKDKAENAYLKKCGYTVIRIPEDKVSEYDTASLFTSEIMLGKEVN